MGVVAIAMFIAIYLLFTRTRVGIVVRSAIYRPGWPRRSVTTCRWSS